MMRFTKSRVDWEYHWALVCSAGDTLFERRIQVGKSRRIFSPFSLQEFPWERILWKRNTFSRSLFEKENEREVSLCEILNSGNQRENPFAKESYETRKNFCRNSFKSVLLRWNLLFYHWKLSEIPFPQTRKQTKIADFHASIAETTEISFVSIGKIAWKLLEKLSTTISLLSSNLRNFPEISK